MVLILIVQQEWHRGAYLRELYHLPAFGSTTNFTHIKGFYFTSPKFLLNTSGPESFLLARKSITAPTSTKLTFFSAANFRMEVKTDDKRYTFAGLREIHLKRISTF